MEAAPAAVDADGAAEEPRWVEIYEQEADDLVRLATLLAGRGAARDLLATAVARVAASGDLPPLTRAVVDAARRRRRRATEGAEWSDGGALYVGSESEVDAREVLHDLAPERAAVLLLTYGDGLGVPEAARRLARPERAVRRQLARTRGLLARALGSSALEDRIRALLADQVAGAPDPPRAAELRARWPADPPTLDRRRRPVVGVAAALGAVAALVGVAVVAQDLIGDHPQPSTAEADPAPAAVVRPAAPARHLLPSELPPGLRLVEAVDEVAPQPFGSAITTQVFTRSDGATVRLAVDPWQEPTAMDRLPGFGRAFTRGGGAGWRNETLGYGLLWFRVGPTRVALQTVGLSVGEAVTFADKLVRRGETAIEGFDPPPGPFRLVAERLAAPPQEAPATVAAGVAASVGTRSTVTWAGDGPTVHQVRLITTTGDPREAWRPLLDGAGQLLQIDERVVRQTSEGAATAFTWVDGDTSYRLEGVGASEAELTAILRSTHAVDAPTWRRAVAAGQVEMASWPATASATLDGAVVQGRARAGGAVEALCVTDDAGRTGCGLVTRLGATASASVTIDGTWWLLADGPADGARPTILPDQGRVRLAHALDGGRSWTAARLPDQARSLAFTFGPTTGSAGRPFPVTTKPVPPPLGS